MTSDAVVSRNEDNIRSQNSRVYAYVRFYNKTQRKVDVIWINYEGIGVKYKTLEPNEYFDATTFVTHPWIFRDSATREKLVAIAPAITCQEVFFAKPWWEHRGQSDPENRGRIERVPVFIRYPLLTLRKASLLAVRRSLANPKDACRLDLPKILQKDIAEWSDDVR
ncbi:protein Vhl-like [Artemia franciscana]|uniref:von Hippel-Lindau disease tumour suppressor beta domain-containing protein n=1 Tax=Artemia franciscana TaxID=6661 RepID=A0AA88HRD9_ARTSF|nr:hypothetical protein QYM36_010894 [Artemia franciscana]